MKEQWKPVSDLEDYYEVSNTGKVRSTDREVNTKHNTTYIRKGRILKGYGLKGHIHKVTLSIHSLGLVMNISIPRLIYKHFIGDISDNEEVIYIDGNNRNYNYKNLSKALVGDVTSDRFRKYYK